MLKKLLLILGALLVGLLLLVFILLGTVLFVPAVQQKIADQLSNYIETKSEAPTQIGLFRLKPFQGIFLEEVLLQTPEADTLAYIQEASLRWELSNLLNGDLLMSSFLIQNARARVDMRSEKPNYQYILDAFGVQESAPDTTNSPPPPLFIGLDSIMVRQLSVDFKMDGLEATADLDSLTLYTLSVDLEKEAYGIDQVQTTGLIADVLMPATTPGGDQDASQPKQTSPEDTTISNLSFFLNHLEVDQYALRYHTKKANFRYEGQLNPEDMGIKDLSLVLDSLHYSADKISAQLKQAKLKEQNGLRVRKLKGDFSMEGSAILLQALEFKTSSSLLNAAANINLPTYDFKGIRKGEVKAVMDTLYFSAEDINYLGAKTAGLNLSTADWIGGNLEADIQQGKGPVDFQLKTSRNSTAYLSGKMRVLKGNLVQMEVDSLGLNSYLEEALWVLDSASWLGNPHPDSVSLHLSGLLNPEKVDISGGINSDWGNAILVADAENIEDLVNLKYQISAGLDDFRVQQIFGDSLPNHIHGGIKVAGEGTSFPDLAVNFSIDSLSFDYLSEEYGPVDGDGYWKYGDFHFALGQDSPVFPFKLLADGFYKDSLEVDWDLTLEPVDLMPLGLWEESLELSLASKGKAKMRADVVSILAGIEGFRIRQEQVDVGFDSLSVEAFFDGDSLQANMTGDLFELEAMGIANVEKWKAYFTELSNIGEGNQATSDSLDIPWFSFDLKWKEHDLYTSGIIPGVRQLASGELTFHWDDRNDIFDLGFQLPRLRMDSLDVYGVDVMIGQQEGKEEAAFHLDLDSLFAGADGLIQAHWKGEILTDSLASTLALVMNEDSLQSDLFFYRDLNSDQHKEVGLYVRNLFFNDRQYGDLMLTAISQEAKVFDLLLDLSGRQKIHGEAKVNLQGESPEAKGFLQLDTLELYAYAPLLEASVDSLSGLITGRLDFEYQNEEPKAEGAIKFREVYARPMEYPVVLYLKDEKILLEKDFLEFEKFGLTDPNGKRIDIQGTLGLAGKQPLDLTIKGKPFLAMNAPKSRKGLAYGDLTIKGDVSRPLVTGAFGVLNDTDLYLRLPDSQGAAAGHDQVIRFKQIETASPKDSIQLSVTAPEIKMKITVDDDSKFTVLVDEYSGDRMEIQGLADLNLHYKPDGTTGLEGNYEVKQGFYKLSFYGLVGRRFDFVQGSKIIFTGAPDRGILNLTARYEVAVPPYPIMVQSIDLGATGLEKAYKKKKDFYIDINISNEISDPRINFYLGMPPRGREDFGGDVYARISEINQDEAQRNKQAVSVLLTSSFIPEEESGGGNAVGNTARSSVSQLVESSLNKLSNSLVKGVDINFAIDNYDGENSAGSTEVGMNVSKSLLDDRLNVSVGGNMMLEDDQQSGASQISEDIEVEYALTQDRRYRLKGFRYQDTEDLLTQDVMTQGISILFSKDYNDILKFFEKKRAQEDSLINE
ncbi:translocation/assembly module TamB domain-containing protein [Persicobacter diffluens]|uniref:Translocation and assembly module TamB C-terminal domain-containing protein n=1 Tax=Persicobacter diffluens TaxID=981 RepID=A0AAN5ANB1_9BACT|nr:hypothetical protein PEDI_37280 [Persicobacter diffluens]